MRCPTHTAPLAGATRAPACCTRLRARDALGVFGAGWEEAELGHGDALEDEDAEDGVDVTCVAALVLGPAALVGPRHRHGRTARQRSRAWIGLRSAVDGTCAITKLSGWT
mmetsp:Transcript_73913/g.240587  ORF Transcript_73913/g.240587 Transcript_73913/m.240587 type:complete len:110 (+) Transcript_73913:69-398(+)